MGIKTVMGSPVSDHLYPSYLSKNPIFAP